MRHEPHNHKTERTAYIEDMKQQQEDNRTAAAEQARREWAQRNGNDSGFDPYAEL